MRRQLSGRIAQQGDESLVDLGGLDRRETQANRHAVEQPFAERRQRDSDVEILTVVTDVDPGDHQLRVVACEKPSFLHHLVHGPRDRRAARDPRRAKRALSVATVLNLEPASRPASVAAQGPRRRRLVGDQPEIDERRGDEGGILPGYHAVRLRHVPVVGLADRGRASGHDDSKVGPLSTQPPNQPSGVRVRLVGHRARIEDDDVGIPRLGDRVGAAALQLLPHAFGVVLVRLTPEGVVPDAGAVAHSLVRAF